MACNHPLPAWRATTPNIKTGRLGVVFSAQGADRSLPLELPCGRCIGCRLEKARGWAIRMVHEAKCHKQNWFVTLTYDQDHVHKTSSGLPTLQPRDFTLFMKRLRKCLGPGIRYYQCGEYGEQTLRPHHHAILFNCPLSDLTPLRKTNANQNATLYKSARLAKLWQNGNISVGQVNFETAAYVASYVTKKITGPTSAAYYNGRTPEYSTMSRRPGIGATFLHHFDTDVYPADEVIIRGLSMKPPRYYDRQLERSDPELYYQVRDARQRRPSTHHEREAKEVTQRSRLRKRDAT